MNRPIPRKRNAHGSQNGNVQEIIIEEKCNDIRLTTQNDREQEDKL